MSTSTVFGITDRNSEFSALTNEESQIDVCNLPKERGDCGKYQLRFYYDQKLGECKYFFYSGCRGNGNNFKGLAECQRTCRYVSSSSPAVAKTERANLFTDISESKSTIKSSPVAETARAGVFESVTLLPNPDTVRSDVSASNSLNGFTSLQRSETSVLPALTARPLSTDQRVDSGAAPPAFGSPGVGSPGNLFSTDSTVSNKESFKPQLLAPEAKSQEPGKNSFPSNRCDQPKDKGPCSGAFIRWYWNPASADCELFTYGGCQGNGNNFDTKEECVSTCKDVSPDVCSHPEDVGDCGSAISRWRYDSTVHLCQPFIYSGCGGNGNNFASHAECRARCER
uniref:BPTI/Kunitz inhibitor domain-containing protein n=1 Tax=Romanomermis culicivorax TaxID=13658 RepID=A0A915KDY4_ROMCU